MTTEMIGTIIGTSIAVVLIMVANWMIFKKAGRPGWQSLIPFYNVYVQYKLCWKGWVGIVSLILGTVIGVLATANADLAILAVPTVLFIAIQIIFSIKFAKAFGKGFIMGLVLMFAAGIGRMILGFGRSRYVRNAA